MVPRTTRADNVFSRSIREGRIRDLQQLRSAYRSLVMKTHPDAIGSDGLASRFVALSSDYEEARAALESRVPATAPSRPRNHRLAYYQEMQRLQTLDVPYTFHRAENLQAIAAARRRARECFVTWNAMHAKLYAQAQKEYDGLKAGKPSGPYMKNALALNVSPVFHNIIAYHLTGAGVYRKQVRQNLNAILLRLIDEGYSSLRDFLLLLIQDMEIGPAVFGSPEAVPLMRRLEGKGGQPPVS
jgi:hypothetical protein